MGKDNGKIDNKKDVKDKNKSYVSVNKLFPLIILIFILGFVIGSCVVMTLFVEPIVDDYSYCSERLDKCVSGYTESIDGFNKCVRSNVRYDKELLNMMALNEELKFNITSQEGYIEAQDRLLISQNDMIETHISKIYQYKDGIDMYRELACNCYYDLSKYKTVCYDDFPDSDECE